MRPYTDTGVIGRLFHGTAAKGRAVLDSLANNLDSTLKLLVCG